MAFLEQLAGALLREHGTDLERVAVVLPSRRAGLYLRLALARNAGKALWSPELFTLSSFTERLSGLRTLPAEELLLEAYEAYRSVAGSDAQALVDFLEWAPVTLADMSEADANMVRLDGFYRDLRSWEELDWSFNTAPLSDGQQRMVRYWAMAGRFHQSLTERLLGAGAGTAGLVSRKAAERGAEAMPWDLIWFAGLNAFTVAEQRVLDAARNAGTARFAWDADRYYLNGKDQEAGAHLRLAIARFGDGVVPVGDDLRTAGPAIEVMSAPNAVAQAWSAADRLRSLSLEERALTAVVLADEGLLPALLGALPADIGPVNVTMGLPLAGLPVGSLVDAFFQCVASSSGDTDRPIEPVLGVLGHPFLRGSAASARMDTVISVLRSKGRDRIRGEELLGVLEEVVPEVALNARAVFGIAPGTDDRTRVMGLLSWARWSMADDTLAIEQLYQTSIVLGRTTELMGRYHHDPDGAAGIAILTRLLRSARIGLVGEPLSGLQVMGLLEARGLDPQRVILLGAQEGKLPAASLERTYIPFELRKAHGLPLRDSGDAVQAYNFLRLIQRASEVLLVHDEQAASGPSRHIAQLRHEWSGARSGRMTFVHTHVPVPVRSVRPIVVNIAAADRERVITLLERGITPTMLRAWLRCPLDHWFRYVCGLREPDFPGARIGSDVLGNALHAVLEEVHRPWLDRPLVASEVEAAIAGIHQALHDRLLRDAPPERLESGQPLLQIGMAARAAANFLQGEANSVRSGIRIVPRALELGLRAEIPGSALHPGVRAFVKGRLDRVDDRDGLPHILDLKTGRVDDADLRIPEISIDALRANGGYAAQLLVYAWLYLTEFTEVPQVRAGLQPLQRASGSAGVFLRVGDREVIERSDLPAITEVLTGMVSSLLDLGTTIAHEPDSAYCVFCARVD